MKSAKFADWIIGETEDYIILNKPPFIPCVHERGKTTATPVIEYLKKHHPGATLCHRLDRETSGLLLVAKNSEAYRHASIQFEKRKVKKIYHAIVSGSARFNHLEVNLPINTEKLHDVRIDMKHGKPCSTLFHTLKIYKHFSLVECMPVTGRLHQIRVHLASQNHPVAGDEKYGDRIPMLSVIKSKIHGEDTPLIRRFALHAFQMHLPVPEGMLSFEAPYSHDFEIFIKMLERYDR